MEFRRAKVGRGRALWTTLACFSARPFLVLALAALGGHSSFALPTNPLTQSEKSETKIAGKVCSASGAAIAGVSVWVMNETQGKVAHASSDRNGKFVVTVAQPGWSWLEMAKPGFLTLRVELQDVLEGQNKNCNVSMKTLPTASGDTDTSSRTMEYSDETNFTIAGVTDWSEAGVHGSDLKVRTGETLAKETAALKSQPAPTESESANEATAHRLEGDAREKNGDPVGAASEYLKAVKLEPSEQNYFAWGAELLLHRAGAAAVEVFSRGREAYPRSGRMLEGLAAAHFAVGRFSEAAECMCEAADFDPQETAPYLFLGRMEQAVEELPECSRARLKRFASEQPQNALANEYFALVLWKKGRREQSSIEIQQAEDYFKKAVAIDPARGDVYVQLGMLYKARGENDRALIAFQKAVTATAKSSVAHYQLSLAYRRAGNAAKSRQEMLTCEELRRSEDRELQKERRELQQFVTTLKDGKASDPK
jgi:tetratricopeptide (TPR) repeat protein